MNSLFQIKTKKLKHENQKVMDSTDQSGNWIYNMKFMKIQVEISNES